MKFPTSKTWKKKLWLLAEFLIPNLIGWLFKSNLDTRSQSLLPTVELANG